jgi:hypothetical protein
MACADVMEDEDWEAFGHHDPCGTGVIPMRREVLYGKVEYLSI